jgi:signal transduction histidine kinase
VTTLRLDPQDRPYQQRLNDALTDELYRRSVLPQVLFPPVLLLLYIALQDIIVLRPSIGWVFVVLATLEIPRAISILGDRWVRHWYRNPRNRLHVYVLFSGLIGVGLGAINLLVAKFASPEQITLLTFATAGFNSVSIVSMNSSLLSYFLRMLPNFGTVPVMILLGPELEYRDTLLTMVAINLVTLSLMAVYVHVHVRDALLLQFRLDDANAELVRNNSTLNTEIEERVVTESVLAQRNEELELLNSRLADTQSQLLQSEKMASIGQLAAGIAHEINNPIAFVRSNLHSLQGYVSDIDGILLSLDEGQQGDTPGSRTQRTDYRFLREDIPVLLEESIDGAMRVERIVRDLKNFSHVDQVDWQMVDIHKGIDTTLNVAAHELKFKVEVIKQYGELPLVQCLPFQINQVFLNLLVNAAHAIEGRGTLTLSTGCGSDAVWIEIADTGRGIEPGHLNRIFEPFFTTKPVGEGTGLGLSVSYSIIRNHGGQIEVASEVGKGTKFTVHLPISPKRVA